MEVNVVGMQVLQEVKFDDYNYEGVAEASEEEDPGVYKKLKKRTERAINVVIEDEQDEQSEAALAAGRSGGRPDPAVFKDAITGQ